LFTISFCNTGGVQQAGAVAEPPQEWRNEGHRALEASAKLPHNAALRPTHTSEANMEERTSNRTTPSNHEYLIQLWSEQLNRPQVGIRDDFFESGGTSMQVIEMLTTVSDKYGKEIDFAEFFKEPCILKLSELLGN
jgi:acyl carrier protein